MTACPASQPIIPGVRVRHKRLDITGTVGTEVFQGFVLADAGGAVPVTWRVEEIEIVREGDTHDAR